MIPDHIKRELLNLQDQIQMAENSGDEVRIAAVECAVHARLDEIEKQFPPASAAPAGASYQTRLGALKNGLW